RACDIERTQSKDQRLSRRLLRTQIARLWVHEILLFTSMTRERAFMYPPPRRAGSNPAADHASVRAHGLNRGLAPPLKRNASRRSGFAQWVPVLTPIVPSHGGS